MRLLLIRPGAIGDTLLTFPVIEALRACLPRPHVKLVGNRAVLPLAQAFGLADEVSDYEEPRWSALFASPLPNHVEIDKKTCRDSIYRVQDLSENITYDANISDKSSDKSADAINRVPTKNKLPDLHGCEINRSLQAELSGTDRAIAWLHDADNIVYQNLQAADIPLVMVAPGRPPEHERMHIVDYLARSVGISTNPHPYYGSCCSVKWQKRAFAIHAGSGGARKCWPPECFAAVIRTLWQWEQAVLLLSGPADQERLEVLLKLLPAPPRPGLLKLLVDVPLLDLVPILCQCRGYLGNDAGMTHLAALLGLPTLALFGPSDPLIWQPRGRAVSIIHEPDLERLEVDTVIAHISMKLFR